MYIAPKKKKHHLTTRQTIFFYLLSFYFFFFGDTAGGYMLSSRGISYNTFGCMMCRNVCLSLCVYKQGSERTIT